MRPNKFLLVLGTALAMSTASMAQMSNTNPPDQQMNPQVTQPGQVSQMPTCPPNQLPAVGVMRATVQQGPIVRAGLAPSADIFVGGRLAMRIASPAGGLSPMQRARVIADRLNGAFSAGYTWNQLRVDRSGRYWTVALGNMPIATADSRSARAMGISTNVLASRWANQTVLAMGGQPSMIAAQLTPSATEPTTMVAGSRQQLGQPVMWQNSPTKTVPVINIDTNTSMGNIVVAGAQDQINKVSSVAMYETTNNGMTVHVFVPITSATTTGVLTRVNGVGVVGLPSSIAPSAANVPADMNLQSMITNMGTRWNAAINARLATQRQVSSANTKIVPLYAADTQQVIGAVQIAGDRVGVAQTRGMSMTTSGDTVMFTALPIEGSTMSQQMQTAALNSVVIAAVLTPCGTEAAPAATPGTTGSAQPEVTTPSAAPTPAAPSTQETPPAPPSTDGTCQPSSQ